MDNQTELNDRTLWYDGDSTISNDSIVDYISRGISTEGLFVQEITKDIKQYNRLVSPEQRISIKTEIHPLNVEWNIPDEYSNINVTDYILDKFEQEINRHQWDEYSDLVVNRTKRIVLELHRFQQQKLMCVLQVLIYIINTLQSQRMVWGVGRGSSVSSYVLYLINVHDVDSVKFDIDIDDFLPSTAD